MRVREEVTKADLFPLLGGTKYFIQAGSEEKIAQKHLIVFVSWFESLPRCHHVIRIRDFQLRELCRPRKTQMQSKASLNYISCQMTVQGRERTRTAREIIS